MSMCKRLLCVSLMMIMLPVSVRAVELSEIDNGRTISVAEGESVSVTLAGNPTTGYLWKLEAVDRSVLAAGAEPVFTRDSSLTGAGGKFTFRFTPLKTGSSAIKLVYLRPWEKDQQPLQTFAALVTVDVPRINSASYRSAAGDVLKASFDLNLDKVTIILPDGRTLTLPSAPSASGARYSNGKETFWEHQGVGRYIKDDALQFEGTVIRGNE